LWGHYYVAVWLPKHFLSAVQRCAEEQELAAQARLGEERSRWLEREHELVGEVEALQESVQQLQAHVAATEQKLRQTVQVCSDPPCMVHDLSTLH